MSSTKKGAAKASNPPENYSEGDMVLGKIKGYPPWPGKVVNEDEVPAHLKKERPPSKKATYYCIRFYPTGEYAWLFARDLSKLQKHEIEAFINEPHRKSAELMEGYKTARDPEKWEDDYKQGLLAQQEAAAAVEDDELQEDEAPAPVVGKKRKRESTAADKKQKKAKLDQLSKKRKSTVKSKKSSAEVLESEDEADGDEDAQASSAPPVAAEKPSKAKKETKEVDDEAEDAALASDAEASKVKEWRHKLQKAFLSKGGPVESDMAQSDQYFTTVENYEGLTIEYLQYSKIGKVMRKIANLSSIPRDDEFKFKDRATTLVAKWHDQLQGHTKTNGDVDATMDSIKAPDAEMKDEEKEAEPAKETVSEAEAAPEPAVNGMAEEPGPSGGADVPMADAKSEPVTA